MRDLTELEVIEDFLDYHETTEDVLEFLGMSESDLERDALVEKYESEVIRRWSDVPFLRHADESYDCSR